MKKIFSILVIIITMNSIYAQDTSFKENLTAVQKTAETVKETTKQVVDQVKSIDTSSIQEHLKDVNVNVDSLNVDSEFKEDIKVFLKTMASELSTTIDHVFDVIVTQQVVKSIALLIPLLLLFIFTLTSISRTLKKTIENVNYVVPIVLSIATIIYASKTLMVILTGIINPEFGAYQDIITFVSTIK